MTTLCRASAAQRIALCPGSRRAEDGLPDVAGPDAEAGTRAHAILARMAQDHDSGSPVAGNDAVADVAMSLWAAFDSAVVVPFGGILRLETETEVAVGAWTGHVDLIAWLGETDGHRQTCHVVDWKTGWGDVPEAAANAQLRVYAVAVALERRQLSVCAHIVSREGVSSVRYDADALADARNEIIAIAEAADKPDAKRIPSADACRYCKAFGSPRCPETLALPAKATAAIPEAVEQIKALAPARLAELLGLATLVEKLAQRLKDEAKARLEADPSSVPGWTLKPGAMRRSIRDTLAAANMLMVNGLPQAAVLRSASLSLPELGRAASDVFNVTRDAGARWVRDCLCLSGLIAEDRAKPSLEEAGE